jgi:hypothetical protein
VIPAARSGAPRFWSWRRAGLVPALFLFGALRLARRRLPAQRVRWYPSGMRALALLALASVLTGCPEQLSPAQRGVPPERVPPAEPVRTMPPAPPPQPSQQPPSQPAPQQPPAR